jgi:DNA-binding CsgD family transcriptional regulator
MTPHRGRAPVHRWSCRRSLSSPSGDVTPRRAGAVQVQALAGIGRADFEEAHQHASKISCAATIAAYLHGVQDMLVDLVEAAVHTGRSAEAAAHVAAIQESTIAALSSRFALVALGSAAIDAATDTSAVERFEEALAVPGADRWSFWMTRVQLAYGERLRRMPTLTAQEREIALLAASGLTNKQIAERLFLSPRTVGGHLHRVFPQLGVATRAALRDARLSAPRRGSLTPDATDRSRPHATGRYVR